MTTPNIGNTSVFIVEPSGWYGIFTLRPVSARMGLDDATPSTAQPEWLKWFYRLIGCTTVDLVRCLHRIDCWVDDEGLIVNEPERNVVAEMMISNLSAQQLAQPIAGTVVFTGSTEDGETVGLNADQFGTVAAAFRMAQRRLIGV